MRPFLPPHPEHDYKHGSPCEEPCGACGDREGDAAAPNAAEVREAHADAGGDLCEDDGSGCCGACGVSLGDSCYACYGVGYHRKGCVESDEDLR